MKLAIIGYGKMGKMVEQTAVSQGHTIGAIVDSFVTEAPAGIPLTKTIIETNFDDIDAAIEFTIPNSAAANITALMKKNIPVVTGTTGWLDKMDEVKKVVEANNGALLWASNFSIGVNLFYRIAWYAAELVNNFSQYDVGGFESHHNKKLDSPSGTAKTLIQGVLSRIDRKNKIVWDTLTERKPLAEELHFPSLRMGNVPGTHSLFFDSQADTIEITHTARSREGFASGAVQAAKWLTGQTLSAEKRRGIFTIDEMLKSILET